MSNDLSVNMRRAELDQEHERARQRGQALRVALGAQRIEVRRPHVVYGPKGIPWNQSDADYLREAARNIEYAKCLGSNLTATVMALLLDAARAIEAGPDIESQVDHEIRSTEA
jgi:hypothetical protein